MSHTRRLIKRTAIFITLTVTLTVLCACTVKEGPLPNETSDTMTESTESTTEPDIREVRLLEDAQKTEGWQVFIDDIYGLYGFKDQDGNIVVEAKFKEAENFMGGRAIVKVASDKYLGILEDGIYGLIDPEGVFVIEPEGLLTRVDQWHYLYAKGDDYYSGYGMDGYSVMKRTFLDGNGQALGEERYYYVEAIYEDLFLANVGTKSLFIDSDGVQLMKYPEFYNAVTSKVTGDTITLVPMDEPSGRIQFMMSNDGQTLEQQARLKRSPLA